MAPRGGSRSPISPSSLHTRQISKTDQKTYLDHFFPHSRRVRRLGGQAPTGFPATLCSGYHPSYLIHRNATPTTQYCLDRVCRRLTSRCLEHGSARPSCRAPSPDTSLGAVPLPPESWRSRDPGAHGATQLSLSPGTRTEKQYAGGRILPLSGMWGRSEVPFNAVPQGFMRFNPGSAVPVGTR